MRTKRSLVISIVAILLVIVLPVVGWTQRWNIYDNWRLRNYTPPAEIAQLASDTTMNDESRRLFYVYHPQLNDKTAFRNNCRFSERTIVLGCYVSGVGIYVYQVTDERLDGVVQVTAAHEMLHAAYGRLSGSEKMHVDKMLNDAFKQITDSRIRESIEDYRRNGADVTNELHSILGTEVRSLPPELENYYKRYFVDRSVVVGFSEKYEQAFTERKAKVAELDARLEDLKKGIDDGQARLNTDSDALERDRQRLESLLAAKNYEAYNAGVNSYNAQVNRYNALVRQVRGQIDEYNRIVAERNAIATEESELVEAIDTRPDTIDGQ